MDSSLNIGFPPRYRPFRLVEDEDSSDTDTGKIRPFATNISHFIIDLTVNVHVFNLLAHFFRCDGRVRRNGSESLATVESHSFTPGCRAANEVNNVNRFIRTAVFNLPIIYLTGFCGESICLR
jgi:hypothetical protein